MIQVFGDNAKNIESGDLFSSTKDSVEGRDRVTLFPICVTKDLSDYAIKTEIAYLITKFDDIPSKTLRQIHHFLMESRMK